MWGELRRLFDSEYLEDFGEWDREQLYGYAPHDAHVMARIDDRVVGHLGWTRREIAVGTETVAIAGVGGVLVCDEARGQRLGVDLMELAARSMRDHGGVSFGYLGCREQVVPFTCHVVGLGSLPVRGRSGAMANLSWTSQVSRSSSGRSPRRSSFGRKVTSTCADGLGSR
nr:GNAT family N-acetyltransferase [Ruania alkalisoli]